MLVTKPTPANSTPLTASLKQNLFSHLQNCKTIKRLSQIHTQIIINGLTQKNFIFAKLLTLYISFNNPQNALRAFSQIENPSTTVYNQVIRCHSQSEEPRESVRIFNQMEARGLVPDGFTYSFVISSCARNRLLSEGKQIHGRVFVNGLCLDLFVGTNLVNFYAVGGEEIRDMCYLFDEMPERNVVTWNSLLSGYIRSKNIDEAIRVFDDMPEKNVVSWTTMISGCAENGKCKQALSLFHEMRRANVELDQVALVSTLSACAELGDLKLGRWIHSYIIENFYLKNQSVLVSLNNALIHMYASCSVIDEAYKVFLGMPHRTAVTWTSMITGFAKQGRGEEAIRIFRWMQCEPNIRPDEITFLGVLCACSYSGFVHEGRDTFKSMRSVWGIEPRIEHYGCIIDLLSRSGYLDEAYKLAEFMPMKPNDAIWGAILSGCSVYKNLELGSHVAQKFVTEVDPDRAKDYLVLVANMYASDMRMQDAADVREKIAGMGAKNAPGRSWIQIEGVVHEFVAFDKSHGNRFLIYEVLDEINRHIKSEEISMDFSESKA